MLWITLVLFIVGEAVANEKYLDVCPVVHPVTNLDINRVLGRWYEAEMFGNIFQFDTRCVSTDFIKAKDGSFQINNKLILSHINVPTRHDGTAKLIGKPGSGGLKVTYPTLPLPDEIPYFILGTNYADWLVASSCRNDKAFRFSYGWILTRKQNPPNWVLEEAYKVLPKNGMSKSDFHKTDQKNCPETN